MKNEYMVYIQKKIAVEPSIEKPKNGNGVKSSGDLKKSVLVETNFANGRWN